MKQGSGLDMDVETRKALATRVRGERRSRKMTQAELARAADVSVGMVSNLERERSVPTPANLRAILRVLEIDVPAEAQETPVVGELEECPTCGRIHWPHDYELVFDVLGAYFNTLTEKQRLEAFGDITRDIMARRLGRRA